MSSPENSDIEYETFETDRILVELISDSFNKINLNSENPVTMTTISLQDIDHYMKIVPPYDGNVKHLHGFIKACDEAKKVLECFTLTEINRKYAFGILKTKFVGDARLIISENTFSDWAELKTYLSSNFEDRLKPETLFYKIITTKPQQNNIYIFLK